MGLSGVQLLFVVDASTFNKVRLWVWKGPQEGGGTTHHVGHFQVTRGEDDGVGGRGHWQHEGKGGAEGAGDHHVQRVQADGLGLGDKRKPSHRTVRSSERAE